MSLVMSHLILPAIKCIFMLIHNISYIYIFIFNLWTCEESDAHNISGDFSKDLVDCTTWLSSFMLKPFLCHPSTATQNIMPPTVGSTLTPQDASITCSSGLIECFVFASIGAVGGSCSGDPFKEDSTNTWDYMPLSATWLKGIGVRFSWETSARLEFF